MTHRIFSAIYILAACLIYGCRPSTTPADQAIAEAVEAEEVPRFCSPDLSFFELTDRVKCYRLYTSYDLQRDSEGNITLTSDAEIQADQRPRTTVYTALFDGNGHAIGDVLESVDSPTPISWRDTYTPGVHTRGEYRITRDNNGYVVEEAGPLKSLRHAWRDGRLAKTVWVDPETDEVMSVKEYTYNNDGLLIETRETYAGDDEPEVTVYTGYRTDNHGNWTMRIGSNAVRESVFAEIRAIDYY